MKIFFQSLRFRLLFWYILSLAFLGTFIVLTVHILQYKYSTQLIIGLFILLAIIGFIAVYRITRSIGFLSSQMMKVSSKTLDKRVTSFKGNDEIAQLAKTINELLDRLDKAFKRERQFIADVAHEMKTPIATLRSSFEVTLQKERSNDEYKKIIKDSITETDRLTTTLKDVLDLAWSEVPNESLKGIFDLSELINEMAEIAQKLGSKKQIEITHSISPHIQMIGFRERLGRALLNIVDNAIKYTRHNGKVHISLIKEYNNALITIKDNGQGIEESEIEHIFDRFYRGSKAEKIFGAGLGLAIAQATVSIHRGVIQVKSKPGVGSTFSIVLSLS
ncbi:HAMP domain-containing histidine kinase [Candidatus Roizmanbacteria bacterium]|nr:HAMP domain-containing histidine kinase [Candidatus Roizmanbacteria bacterium]